MMPTKEEMYKALEERHGKEVQERFRAASVAVCGLGGLGSNVAIALARAGVGRLHLIDFDSVDITNLNRQQYFPEQLGQPKAQALYDTIKRIAPYCELTSQSVKLSDENIPDILSPFDIIAECFDKADQKAMLVNCVLEKMPGKYLVAASGMAGLSSANEIRTRRLSKRFYICGDGENGLEKGLGLISARVEVCASHEATMILRIIAGQYEP
ncbi:MAG: sulfur carrier protein ThiS adenylyltransferase ThiF [Ruminococcus sp.]|nr:sulfur carrier protein ThiS adenylyltransferase ThiF [Ruminococcus sp.]